MSNLETQRGWSLAASGPQVVPAWDQRKQCWCGVPALGMDEVDGFHHGFIEGLLGEGGVGHGCPYTYKCP